MPVTSSRSRVPALIALCLTWLVSAAGVASAHNPPHDAATKPTKYELRVGPGYWCDRDDPYWACTTDLVAEMGSNYADDDTRVKGKLRNLSTGEYLPGFDYLWVEEWDSSVSAETDDAPLPAGSYHYVVTWEDPARWWCSEYNPEGCTWLSATNFSLQWKFSYDGTSAITVLPYFKPTTEVRNGWFRKKGNQRWATGRVFANTERADFTLTPLRRQTGRKVLIERSNNGSRWTLVKKGKTDRTGRYEIRWRMPPTRHYWRVRVPAKAGAPETAAHVRGLWRFEATPSPITTSGTP